MSMAAPSEPMVDPLNPLLYSLLQNKFGEIKIANEGVSAAYEVMPDPYRPGRTVLQGHNWGEYYCVNCPFCKDTRHRLWINHLYGSDYDHGRRLFTHLAHCYNENCTRQPGRGEQLEDLVFGYGKPIIKRAPIKAVTTVFAPQAVDVPGEIVPVDEMPETHPVFSYLRTRKFDPEELARDFSIGVCVKVTNDRYRIANNRLYIPVRFNGALVGWQARAIGDDSFGPKYFNAPGMSKSKLLYNYDRASTQPFVIVVEGVPSVWRLGAAAVALFGKTMSTWQRTTISTTWAGKPVYLMLDADARAEMEQAISLLSQSSAKVVPVYLPDKRDPADYSRDEVFSLISMTASAAGLSAF